MSFPRHITTALLSRATQYPVVTVTGPRQAGKTTVCKEAFPTKPYVNLEQPDQREFAVNDPRGFLAQFPQGAILDEIQRAPEILSYLQQILDEDSRRGKFVLTGSNNFLLVQSLTQSLAGRVASTLCSTSIHPPRRKCLGRVAKGRRNRSILRWPAIRANCRAPRDREIARPNRPSRLRLNRAWA